MEIRKRMQGNTSWARLRHRRRLSRRAMLAASARAGIGAAGIALVGCGGDDDGDDGDDGDDESSINLPIKGAADSQTSAATPGAEPQSGGTLRLHASLNALDFFDIHRSQFVTTQTFSALQQNKLLRYADINAGRLEADLASIPEIPDASTYVFLLRPNVSWWNREPTDGRPFSADDVRLNVERQIAGVDASGAPDPLFLRQPHYARTISMDAVDQQTIVFRTDGPDAPYLTQVHAGPWSFMQAPEAWAIFGDRLRDEPLNPSYYTGTGPFQVEVLVAEDQASFRRTRGYFRPGRPFLDRVVFSHLLERSTQEAAYRDDLIDAWSPGDPHAIDGVLNDFPDHVVQLRPLPFPLQLSFSFRDESAANPLADPRLARAIHLALDRRGLMQRAYGRYARLSGPAPWFSAGWAMTDADLTDQPGYRSSLSAADRSAIRDLVAAAGYEGPLPVVVPDVFEATYPGISTDLRDSLRERLGVDVVIRTLAYTRIIEGLRDGSVSVVVGWGEAITDPDPTAQLLRTVRTDAPDNLGGYTNPLVDTGLERMRTTTDLTERRQIFQDAVQPLLLETPPSQVNVANGIQRTIHPPGVHLPNFGFGWDAHRFEDAWLQPTSG